MIKHMTGNFNKNIHPKNIDEDSTKYIFPYITQVFELNKEIEKETNSIIKEEEISTSNIDMLLNESGYTERQIKKVEEHLQDLAQSSKNTNDLIEKLFKSSIKESEKVSNVKEQNALMDGEMNIIEKMFNEFIILCDKLKTQYESIEQFTNVISSVAKQTKLLSLNASIEASRAGEYGRGFSIVADEIKKLSVNSQENVKDIINSLKGMTEIIEQLSIKSKEGMDKVSSAVQGIKKSDVLMDGIVLSQGEFLKHFNDVKSSQKNNLSDVEKINHELTNIIKKSNNDKGQFEGLIMGSQKKADYILNILHHLNQIRILWGKYVSKN
ncbi:methyl-accepting chemotaxis protein [Clostridium kluyveri]|uniref:methyl-accepting chemotaxis protein n=1 Tax=Clostridium kluyveri TaxID=1534 RepID=UPI002245AA78|nr:methyl-accepting chemotaxis protein [Clostridium kluyveri]UZQ50577.1 methyl-accepting chemotaxis protein [Clostridium kluyveri]